MPDSSAERAVCGDTISDRLTALAACVSLPAPHQNDDTPELRRVRHAALASAYEAIARIAVKA